MLFVCTPQYSVKLLLLAYLKLVRQSLYYADVFMWRWRPRLEIGALHRERGSYPACTLGDTVKESGRYINQMEKRRRNNEKSAE
jgi:hypothetical protein